MSRFWRRAIALATLATLALAVGCGSNSGNAPPSSNFELKIGMVNGFTGDFASYTAGDKAAAQIAVDYVNKAAADAGLKVTVKFYAEDSQSTATGATEAATKLVQVDGVSVLIGTVTTEESIPVAKTVAIPNHVVQFALSTSPLLAEISGAGKYLFRTTPSDVDQTTKLAEYMKQTLGDGKTVNIVGANDPAENAQVQAFTNAWTKVGGKVGTTVTYDASETSYDSDAAKAVSGQPDGWVDFDLSDQFAKFLPALVRTGSWDPSKTFTTDNQKTADLPKQVGPSHLNGIRGTAAAEGATPTETAFNNLYSSKTTTPQVYAEPNTFDAVVVAFLAAVRAGSASGTAIADNVRAVSSASATSYTFSDLGKAIAAVRSGKQIHYVGASGPLEFDAHGDPTGNAYEIWQFEPDGSIKVIVPQV